MTSPTWNRKIRLWCVALLAVVAGGAALAPSALACPTAGLSAWRDSSATRTGPFSSQHMSFTMVLSWRNAAALEQRLSGSRSRLSSARFDALFSPRKTTITAVRRWARANHMKVTRVSKDRVLITLSGSSSAIGNALGTRFASYHSKRDGSFFNITRSARLPRAFASSVSAVVGLSSLDRVTLPRPAVRSASDLSTVQKTAGSALSALGLNASSGLNYPASYKPQDFWQMYDAPSAQTGSGQQESIITEGNVSQPKTDLATFEKAYGLPSVTWNQINVGTPTSDTSGDDEWDLDSQYSTGFAPGVSQLNVYVAPTLNDSDILTTIDKWATDNLERQGSFSAGECDLLAAAAGFTSGLDTVLQKADAQGQSMFFASGDTGSFCPAVVGVNGVPAGIPDTNYPASSPYGIGVGGTSVLSPSGPSEIAWYAGGGGFSPLETTPTFQANTSVFGVGPMLGRGVPDVSLDADPESGYDVVVNGTVTTIGGTSASTPSWQGIWARAQGAHGGGLGFAGPVLYKTVPPSAFHDITIGGNGLYAAGPGYDLVTGLGTPDISKLVSGA